jgi:hypothetical protein
MERLGGGSGSSSDDDFDEEAAIEAYRYLEEWGLDLLDVADVKECVELARVLMREERDPIEGNGDDAYGAFNIQRNDFDDDDNEEGGVGSAGNSNRVQFLTPRVSLNGRIVNM